MGFVKLHLLVLYWRVIVNVSVCEDGQGSLRGHYPSKHRTSPQSSQHHNSNGKIYTPPPNYTSVPTRGPHDHNSARSSHDRLPGRSQDPHHPSHRLSPDHIPRSHERLHYRPAHSSGDHGRASPLDGRGSDHQLSEHSLSSSSQSQVNHKGKRRKRCHGDYTTRDQATNTDLSSNGQCCTTLWPMIIYDYQYSFHRFCCVWMSHFLRNKLSSHIELQKCFFFVSLKRHIE